MLLELANWFGSAVCHQWDSHSYVIGGVPLCLCARCTGMYLAALLTLVLLRVREPRAAHVPRPAFLVAFLLFFVMWAGDGVNSFLSLFPAAPALYPPQNILRLTTGALMGIGLGSLLYLMLNSILYRGAPGATPLFGRARDFFALLGMAGLLVAVVESQWAPLLYPLTALLLAAVLGVNIALWTALAGSFVRGWKAVALGVGIALLLLDAIALGRGLLGIPSL